MNINSNATNNISLLSLVRTSGDCRNLFVLSGVLSINKASEGTETVFVLMSLLYIVWAGKVSGIEVRLVRSTQEIGI